MERQDFRQWLNEFAATMPQLNSQLENFSNKQGIKESWYAAMAHLELTDATDALQAILRGEAKRPFLDDVPATINEAARKIARERRFIEAKTIRDERPEYLDAYRCLRCHDTRLVGIVDPKNLSDLRAGTEPHSVPWHEVFVRCDCQPPSERITRFGDGKWHIEFRAPDRLKRCRAFLERFDRARLGYSEFAAFAPSFDQDQETQR